MVINPIVPFVTDPEEPVRRRTSPPKRVSQMGFPQIGYQAFKLVAHRRLHEQAAHWKDTYPGVDIVLDRAGGGATS